MASQQPDVTRQAPVQGQMERIDKSGVSRGALAIVPPEKEEENKSGEDGFSEDDDSFYGGQ